MITSDGGSAGDDILIYDATRFPKIRSTGDNDFSKKQKIPIEAVYAYIETKTTLYIDEKKGQNETFKKALSQIKKVKNTCEKRERVPYNTWAAMDAKPNSLTKQEFFPEYRNPIFTCVFSRYLKSHKFPNYYNEDFEMDNHTLIEEQKYFKQCANKVDKIVQTTPDLIIAGKNHIVVPVGRKEDKKLIGIPFRTKDTSLMLSRNHLSIGIGIIHLMMALDFIRLGDINYQSIIWEGLNI
jgi:hypothetical protein